jgi:transglutaminase-like putative cysteine protease
MRLRITHETTYRYEQPAARVIQMLRLTPQNHNGQFVAAWRLEVSADGRLTEIDDPYGNSAHSFSADGPLDSLSVTAVGEVGTDDTAGIVRGAIERLPMAVYLRETPLTTADAAILAFVAELGGRSDDPLDLLHALCRGLHDRMHRDPPSPTPMRAATETFAAGGGTAQELAHVFLAAARAAGVPSRYVAGYLYRDAAEREADAGHGWAEAHIDGIGWIGFDPSLGLCPADAHVRVATALDWFGAAPLRGARTGGEGESIAVRVTVDAVTGRG